MENTSSFPQPHASIAATLPSPGTAPAPVPCEASFAAMGRILTPMPRYDVSRRIRTDMRGEVLRARPAYTLGEGLRVVLLHAFVLACGVVFGCVLLFEARPGPEALSAVVSAAAPTWDSLSWEPHGLVFVPFAWIVVGSRYRALANVVHECAHGAFFRSPRANAFLGRLLALLDFQSFDTYVREHRSHHTRLGVPGEDLDFEARRPFGFASPANLPTARYLSRALGLGHLRRYLRPRFLVPSEGLGWTSARTAWLALVLGGAFLAPGPVIGFVVLPWLTVYQVLRFWSDALDHSGCLHEEEEFLRSRNHLLPWRALEWLLLPRNDAYHLVHHLFPSLPTRYFPQVHAEVLMRHSAYAARRHRWSARDGERPLPGQG